MSNPWFRLYSEIIDDEKLLMLAFQDRWHYVAILCLKNRGLLDQEKDPKKLNRKVAAKLGITLSEADELRRRLAEEELIEFETWQPTGWDQRQFKSDSSAERVRAYRERQKKQPGNVTCNVTCNVTETAQETDTESDTETLAESAGVFPAREPEPATLSHTPPRDFEPDAEWHATGRQRNPGADYERELATFRLWEFPTPRSDWQSAWAKWWLDARPSRRQGDSPMAIGSPESAVAWSEVQALAGNSRVAHERVSDPLISQAVQEACGGWGALGRASPRDLRDYGFRFREVYTRLIAERVAA